MPSLFNVFLLLNLTYTLASTRIMAPGDKLHEGKNIEHKNCMIFMQKDGNLVVKRDNVNTWSTEGRTPGSKANEFYARMQRDGNFLVKSRGQSPVFSTRTQKNDLDDDLGGLYFNEDCILSIAKDSSEDIIWSNIRSKLHSGNRLRKGEMFHYPPSDPKYTLYLQHDGNLVVFRGADFSDFNGPKQTIFSAHAFSKRNDFYLKVSCDGRLILKELVNDDPKQYEMYWFMQLVDRKLLRGSNTGYSLTLSNDDIGFVEEDECKDENYTM